VLETPIQETDILVGIIGAIAAVLAASLPYYFTKKNEIAVAIKKTKLERYDDLLQKFSTFLEKYDRQSAIHFIMAYNRASAYASDKVLTAIDEYMLWRGLSLEEHLSILKVKVNTEEEKNDEKKFVPKIMTAANARLLSRKIRELISNIFIAIREDVNPQEPHFNFRSYRPEDLSEEFSKSHPTS